MLITFKVHLQNKGQLSTLPWESRKEHSCHGGFDLEPELPLFVTISTETIAVNWWRGKNRLYVAISFDTRFINSPAFPGQVIIYPICQSWYLTTLSSELLTCQEQVCLVNHRKMTASPDLISDKRKRGTQEQTLGRLLARPPGTTCILNKEIYLFLLFLRPSKKSLI